MNEDQIPPSPAKWFGKHLEMVFPFIEQDVVSIEEIMDAWAKAIGQFLGETSTSPLMDVAVFVSRLVATAAEAHAEKDDPPKEEA